MGIREGDYFTGVKCLRGFEEGNYLLKPIPQDGRINKAKI
jgi:hypothetical protein